MLMNLSDFANNNNNGLSLDDKVEILGLNEQRVNELKKTIVEQFPLSNCENKKMSKSLKLIDTDKIVGLARPVWGETSWLEILDNKYCHKDINFEEFEIDMFDDVLMKVTQDGYPSVIEYKNKYYISGNGLHRLSIAKCIGNKKAKVNVIKYH